MTKSGESGVRKRKQGRELVPGAVSDDGGRFAEQISEKKRSGFERTTFGGKEGRSEELNESEPQAKLEFSERNFLGVSGPLSEEKKVPE